MNKRRNNQCKYNLEHVTATHRPPPTFPFQEKRREEQQLINSIYSLEKGETRFNFTCTKES